MRLYPSNKIKTIFQKTTIFVVIFSWLFSGYPPIDFDLDLAPKVEKAQAAVPQNGRAAFITAQDPHTYWELNSTNLGINFGHDVTASGGDNPNVIAGDISTSDGYEGMSNQNDPTISSDLDVMIVTDSAFLLYIPAGLAHDTVYGIWHNGGGTNAQGTAIRATVTGIEIACTHNNAANVMDTLIEEISDASLPAWFSIGCQLASNGGAQGDMGLWIDGVLERSGTRVNTLDYGSGDPDFGNFGGTEPDAADVIDPASYSGGDWGGNTAITGSGILIANFTADNPTNNGSGDGSPGAGDDFYTDYYDAHNSSGPTPTTNQLHFRWRDDSAALNTDSGWLAAEDSNGISDASKETAHRLRFEVVNTGTAVETSARTYEIEYGVKGASCGAISTWTGIADATDAFEMVDSTNITSDGQATTALFANTETYTFTAGEGIDVADITGFIGPLTNDYYTEIEYSFQPTDNAVTGETYCFRLYDATADSVLDAYNVFPEITMNSTDVSYSGTIMEWGTEASVGDDAWTTVNFSGTYIDPIFVCTNEYYTNIGNESDGTTDSVVCRVQSVGATSAQVRLQEPGTLVGAAGNLMAEKIHWMVVEAGNYDTGDIKMEAFKYTSTVTDGKHGWTGQSQTLTQSYTAPVVVGQVMTTNDTGHSQFWAHNGSNGAPTSASLYAGKQLSEDSDTTRSDETVGVIVIEQANDTVNGIIYEARLQTQTIERIDDPHTNYTFNTAFSSTPAVGIISLSGVSGTDGPITSLYGATPISTTNIYPVVMETEILDTEQNGNTEYIPYIVFESAGTYSAVTNVALDQDTFRFYNNVNEIQPSTPLANENEAIINVVNTSILRLRAAVQAGDLLQADSLQFKLQYGEGSTCSAVSSWFDVGPIDSGTIWRGYDNAAPPDGTTITSSLLNSQSNALETYEEVNNSTLNSNSISDGARGEWDWVIQNNGATGSTDYCFRMTKSDSSVMEYTRYPKVTTAAGAAISISLNTDGSVALGTVALNASEDTTVTGINDAEVVSVDNGPADLDIKSTVFTEGANTWALAASNGVNQMQWDYSSSTSPWYNFTLADTLYTLDTNVAESATRNIYLKITIPTATDSYNQYSGIVTIVASAP